MLTENLNNLVINKLTQEQFNKAREEGRTEEHQLYFTPMEDINATEVSFTPSDSLNSANVQEAIIEVFNKNIKDAKNLSIEQIQGIDALNVQDAIAEVFNKGGKIDGIKLNGNILPITDKYIELNVLPLTGGTITGNLSISQRLQASNLRMTTSDETVFFIITNATSGTNTYPYWQVPVGYVSINARLQDVTDPVNAQDAATKAYVDNLMLVDTTELI